MAKPVRLSELQVFLDKALDVERLRRRDSVNRRIVKTQEPFFGTSKGMTRVKELLLVASESASPILLLGESGTGKSVVARHIHEHSARREAAFVEVNCSSLKGDLLANELFGHARGAFTSAYEDRQGLLEAACQGTLFLDEISDMDPTVQAQFLTVLEGKRFRRLGETRERSSDFRLIAASNRDLEDEVVSGRFRKDLFFRINVLPVSLPPLRERLMDIPPLVGSLLASLGDEDHEVLPETLSHLRRYDWPGNIRELKNVLERAILLARGEPLAPGHFPGLQAGGRLMEKTAHENGLPVDKEARRIRAALEQCGGSVQRAAVLLGVSRATLYRRLKDKKIR